MVRSSLCVSALFLLACGGGAPTPESAPTAEPTPALVQATAEATRPQATPPKALKPPPKRSGTDPLAQTLALPAGDLHVVFTNNLDGDIDPCG